MQGDACGEFIRSTSSSSTTDTFGVTFPLFEKLVVSGVDTHPLFAWLTAQRPNWMLERVKWNFEKWLLSRDGWVVERYASTTAPEALERTIESLLAEGEK